MSLFFVKVDSLLYMVVRIALRLALAYWPAVCSGLPAVLVAAETLSCKFSSISGEAPTDIGCPANPICVVFVQLSFLMLET